MSPSAEWEVEKYGDLGTRETSTSNPSATLKLGETSVAKKGVIQTRNGISLCTNVLMV